MSLKALLFDCDGVIAETEAYGHRVAFNNTFAQEDIDIYWSVEEYGRLVKVSGGKERMRNYFCEHSNKYPAERFTTEYISHLHRIKTTAFMDLSPLLPPRPGVERLMLEAVESDVQVYICSTSNEKSVSTIAKALLGNDMNKVVTHIFAGDVVKAKKPAPDIYRMVCDTYGIQARDCLVIEDSRAGLLAANAAGMRCVITKSMYSRYEDFTEAVAVVECLGDDENAALPSKGLSCNLRLVTLDTLRELC